MTPSKTKTTMAARKVSSYLEMLRERVFREQVIKEKRRPDGRKFDQIRDIWIEVGVLPRTHGSAIFTRGETQALVTTTLGTGDDMQRLEAFEGEAKKRFMLHYNFPPFSVGEVAFLRGAGRREIGHGALAERAISAVLPDEADLPYAIRVVSDILESNGSSSMATVCGGFAQPDGCRRSAQGSGRRCRHGPGEGRRQVRHSDRHRRRRRSLRRHGLQGRRHPHGITALQMDIKVIGITPQIMREALEQAREGRLFILDKMNASSRAAHQVQRIRSALLHPADSDGQNSRPYRTRRQSHPRHH